MLKALTEIRGGGGGVSPFMFILTNKINISTSVVTHRLLSLYANVP